MACSARFRARRACRDQNKAGRGRCGASTHIRSVYVNGWERVGLCEGGGAIRACGSQSSGPQTRAQWWAQRLFGHRTAIASGEEDGRTALGHEIDSRGQSREMRSVRISRHRVTHVFAGYSYAAGPSRAGARRAGLAPHLCAVT
eukprot:6790473-Prymnesium_polylepis.1